MRRSHFLDGSSVLDLSEDRVARGLCTSKRERERDWLDSPNPRGGVQRLPFISVGRDGRISFIVQNFGSFGAIRGKQRMTIPVLDDTI
jgi:hypothetical protein